jgi:2'-5' RNA ligase
MRYFLGFDIAANSKLAIQGWREKSLPACPAPVPARNFHITAVFLGQVNDRQLEQLCLRLDTLQLSPFRLHLDMMGYWSKPKILWLGCSDVPHYVVQLQQSLHDNCKAAGIELANRDYIPHVTLIRKITSNPPAALLQPNFEIAIDKLHLFESVSGKQGVHYPIRQSWQMRKPLRPNSYKA